MLRLFGDPETALQVQVIASPEKANDPTGILAEHEVCSPSMAIITQDLRVIRDGIHSAGIDPNAALAMRRLGAQLQRMLFPPAVWQLFLQSFRRSLRQQNILRVRLLIEPDLLAGLPYEYMYVPEWETDPNVRTKILNQLESTPTIPHHDWGADGEHIPNGAHSPFLVLNPGLSIVRLGSISDSRLSLVPADVLRVLVVLSNFGGDRTAGPDTAHQIDSQSSAVWEYLQSLPAERDAVLGALRPLERQVPRLIELKVAENPTPNDLRDLVRDGHHVLIYLGHSYYNERNALGKNLTRGLVLNDENGRPVYLEADSLTDLLAKTSVRLVVLNACETMREDAPALYRSTAWTLAKAGLSVIAMHFEQPDAAGLILGDAFWRSVARQDPIDASLAYARQVLANTFTTKRPEWGNAALITHSPDGAILAHPRDVDRANYVRVLERRFPVRVDGEAAKFVLRRADGERWATDIATKKPRLIVSSTHPDQTLSKLVQWTRLSEARGALASGTLPICLALSPWNIARLSLHELLKVVITDLGISPEFSEVLLEYIRLGQAVVMFYSSDQERPVSDALTCIVDTAAGVAYASHVIFVAHPAVDTTFLQKNGFDTVTLEGDDEGKSPPLEIRVWAQPVNFSHEQDILVIPKNTKSFYRIGDQVRIRFWANASCYLTLINVGTSGVARTIFPNSIHADSYIAGGVVHEIPDPAHDFIFRLNGPPGIERIRAVATRRPKTSGIAFGSERRPLSGTARVRDIAVLPAVGEAGLDDCSEAACEIEVQP